MVLFSSYIIANMCLTWKRLGLSSFTVSQCLWVRRPEGTQLEQGLSWACGLGIGWWWIWRLHLRYLQCLLWRQNTYASTGKVPQSSGICISTGCLRVLITLCPTPSRRNEQAGGCGCLLIYCPPSPTSTSALLSLLAWVSESAGRKIEWKNTKDIWLLRIDHNPFFALVTPRCS